jgi:hypothetical protein
VLDRSREELAPQNRAISSSANRHTTRDTTGDLQQASLHVNDLVLAVPFAREEVLQAVGLEQDGAVDEAVVVGAGVVPERDVAFDRSA